MATTVTQRQLDQKIKIADDKIEKYQGYIAKLREEKKELNAQKRKLAAAKASTAKKTTAAKTAAKTAAAKKTTAVKKTAAANKTTTTARKAPAKKAKKPEPGFLEGVLEGVGIDPKDLLESLLGKK